MSRPEFFKGKGLLAPKVIIFSSLSGHTKLVGTAVSSTMVFEFCVWCCTTYMCEEMFYNQADAKGGGGGGGGGGGWFTVGQKPKLR